MTGLGLASLLFAQSLVAAKAPPYLDRSVCGEEGTSQIVVSDESSVTAEVLGIEPKLRECLVQGGAVGAEVTINVKLGSADGPKFQIEAPSVAAEIQQCLGSVARAHIARMRLSRGAEPIGAELHLQLKAEGGAGTGRPDENIIAQEIRRDTSGLCLCLATASGPGDYKVSFTLRPSPGPERIHPIFMNVASGSSNDSESACIRERIGSMSFLPIGEVTFSLYVLDSASDTGDAT